VESAKELRFGDLILAPTDTFTLRWNDRKSGADNDVAFWHPVAPEGFSVLGDIGVPTHSDINGTVATLCVKAADNTNSPLSPPVRYELIWKDKGSGAADDGSAWRPVPPDGYVDCGDVLVKGHVAPNVEDVMCVRADLTFPAKLGG